MAIAEKLTFEDAVRYAEEIVAEFGEDHVYTRLDGSKAGGAVSCVYADMDENDVFQPSCIVGRVFAKHGLTGEELADWDGHGTIACVYEDAVYLTAKVRPVRPEVDEATLSFLSRLQSYQDAGHTWGQALRYAKGKVAA